MAVTFDNFQPINNTGFVRGQCKVAYAGKNRNYTDIPRTAFDSAESTIFGVPIVGNWLEDIHNFGGHDLMLETRGNKLSIKDNTVPYGFVPQDANPRWEEIYDENGNAKSYFVVDVILWKERYPEPIQFIIDNKVNQSMEIMVKDGEWDDDWEYFVIHDFYYSALCLLGRDVDEEGTKGEDNVEPCFEQSEVEIVDFNMSSDFQNTFEELKEAFKGGETVGNVATYEAEFKALTTKFKDLNEKHETLQIEYKQLKQERDELQSYKDARELEILNAQKQEVINEYSLLLDEDEMEDIISNQDNYSLEELKSNLATIFADKSLEQAKQKHTKSKKTEDVVVFDNKQPSEKPKKNRFAI